MRSLDGNAAWTFCLFPATGTAVKMYRFLRVFDER